ncbi:MAG: hypothetical protein EXQ96_09955 [Alphaproteobacteria bacterium]|nr:hypothetical protein [Alphaproteobacteria bacterium]
MSGWHALGEEFARWREVGRGATLWWRDDDAGAATPALGRLLALAQDTRVPLALAAVPAWLTPEAAAWVLATPKVRVLQHGMDHSNRAPEGARKCEFPPGDGAAEARLAAGSSGLRAHFGVQALPVLVPPWNRIAPELVARLPAAGFRGLSTYQARGAKVPGLAIVNAHADIIDWQGMRGFVGEAAALHLVTRHLAARRLGTVDGAEPTGLLTHHAVHGEDAWTFLARLMEWVQAHATHSWLDPADLFESPG